MLEIAAQRLSVVKEARQWIGTPFRHNGGVLGAGCDCSHLGLSYSRALGVKIVWPELYISNPQWFMHANVDTGNFDELYLDGLLDNGFVEISDGQADFSPYRDNGWIDAQKDRGDCVIAMIGRVHCHGAIIDRWPKVIQAEPAAHGRGWVDVASAHVNFFLTNRHLCFFSRKEWHVRG